MFGKGSIEDARALQASFSRAKSPRRRGASRNSSMGNRGNGANPRRGRNDRAGPEHRGQHGYAQQPRDFQPSRDPYVPPQRRPYFAQQQPRTNDLLDFDRSPPPRPPVQRQDYAPPQQQRQPTPPVPAPAPAPAFAPPQYTRRASAQVSLLDIKEEEISQPVLQFTSKEGSPNAQKVDATMNGKGKTGDSVTSPLYGGLNASRWNTESSDHPASSPMDASDNLPRERDTEERRESPRRGLASPGRTVTSGMLRGPGLSSSRWAL